MLELTFNFFSEYLIEIMTSMLVIALCFRWIAYKSSKIQDNYFSTFTNEIDKILLQDKNDGKVVSDTDGYIAELLTTVEDKLPKRTIRNKKKKGLRSIPSPRAAFESG